MTQLHGQRSNHLLRACVCVGRVSSLSVAQREVLPRLFFSSFSSSELLLSSLSEMSATPLSSPKFPEMAS